MTLPAGGMNAKEAKGETMVLGSWPGSFTLIVEVPTFSRPPRANCLVQGSDRQ